MNTDQALNNVMAALRQGADLRLQVGKDCGPAIVKAADLALRCLRSGGKLLFFGNGGSAADAQHLAAEFVGRFVKERRGLPALALTTDSSILTAYFPGKLKPWEIRAMWPLASAPAAIPPMWLRPCARRRSNA